MNNILTWTTEQQTTAMTTKMPTSFNISEFIEKLKNLLIEAAGWISTQPKREANVSSNAASNSKPNNIRIIFF